MARLEMQIAGAVLWCEGSEVRGGRTKHLASRQFRSSTISGSELLEVLVRIFFSPDPLKRSELVRPLHSLGGCLCETWVGNKAKAMSHLVRYQLVNEY
jgi:hypothetical protein